MARVYRSPRNAEQVRAWCHEALARWAVPHNLHAVDTACGETSVVSAGAGPGVCIYLPGTNFNAASSTVVLAALATRCRVYAADLPGQPGLSTPTRPEDEVRGYAAWLKDLLGWVGDRHDGQPPVVAAHSRGAAVALSADPATVRGLALFSPAGLTKVSPTLAMLRATVPWILRRNEAGARRLLTYMSGPGHEPSSQLVAWMTLVARACHTTGAPDPLPEDNLIRWKGKRVQVVVGDHDVFFPISRLREISSGKLGADPVVVDNAGHLLVDEEPELAAKIVTNLF